MAKTISELDGVGAKTVKAFNSIGIKDMDDLAKADPDEIASADIGVSTSRAKEFVRQAKQNAVIIQSAGSRQEDYDARGHVSTGIPLLDEVLGGGFEERALIAAYGSTGSAKTQLAFQSMVSAVEQTGLPAVYIETEPDRFRPNRIKQFITDEEVMENFDDLFYVVKAYSLDQQFAAYASVQKAFDEVCLVVVDSFTARFRLSDRFESRAQFSERSQEFKKHLNALETMAFHLECPVLLTAQVYGNPDMYGANESIYGASIFMHMASYFLYLKKSTGEMRKLRLENHPEFPNQELYLQITENGILGKPVA